MNRIIRMGKFYLGPFILGANDDDETETRTMFCFAEDTTDSRHYVELSWIIYICGKAPVLAPPFGTENWRLFV